MRTLTTLTALLATATLTYAQDTARLSQIHGKVSIRQGAGKAARPQMNQTLAPDEVLSTGLWSGADVEFGTAGRFQMQADSELRVAELEPGRFTVELRRGVLRYETGRPSGPPSRIETPSVSVIPIHEGAYQIGVTQFGESYITTEAGYIEVWTPKGSDWVYPGQKLTARGSRLDPQYKITSAYSMLKRLGMVLGSINIGGGGGGGSSAAVEESSSNNQSSHNGGGHHQAAASAPPARESVPQHTSSSHDVSREVSTRK